MSEGRVSMKDLYGIVGDRVPGEGQRQKQIPSLRCGMTKKNCNRNCNGKSKSKMRGFFASLRMTNKKVDA
jgi:hypothetical protein